MITRLHTNKCFQILLVDVSKSIYQLFLSNVIIIICLHTVKWFQVLLFNTKSSI